MARSLCPTRFSKAAVSACSSENSVLFFSNSTSKSLPRSNSRFKFASMVLAASSNCFTFALSLAAAASKRSFSSVSSATCCSSVAFTAAALVSARDPNSWFVFSSASTCTTRRSTSRLNCRACSFIAVYLVSVSFRLACKPSTVASVNVFALLSSNNFFFKVFTSLALLSLARSSCSRRRVSLSYWDRISSISSSSRRLELCARVFSRRSSSSAVRASSNSDVTPASCERREAASVCAALASNAAFSASSVCV
mmetsp:Transcript_40872/g.102943  ORF Transcript_40872/g.102943 Transcript_40872/m.102943 type:complete len:253 (-) Transcript_40872:124-882(-)